MRPSRLKTDSAAAIIPSTGNLSGSLLPPVKSNLTRPAQRAAGGGRPAAKNGAKSNDVALMDEGLSLAVSIWRYLSNSAGSISRLGTTKPWERTMKIEKVGLMTPGDMGQGVA